ncbi:RNA-binding protein Vts1p [Diutina catenulata]
MDFNPMNSPSRFERPIILSPPPLDTPPEQQAAMRQHSVGYNLQQEFAALNENLDLDLKDTLDTPELSKTSSSSGTTKPVSLMAPSSRHGFSQDLLGSMNQSGAMSGLSREGLLSNSGIFDRPSSVNDFSAMASAAPASSRPHPGGGQFYTDVIAFTNWIETLAPHESVKMVDFLCHNLPLDLLLTFKSKLDAHLTTYGGPQAGYLNPYGAGPQGSAASTQDLYNDLDSLSLASPAPQLAQPKPKPNFRHHHLFSDAAKNRPKSADPSLQPGAPNGAPQLATAASMDRARSPTSHLFEKTNFLQLAAATSQTSPMHSYSHLQSAPFESSAGDEDLSAHAALKLGALATINSRVALDSNRKQGHHQYYQRFDDSINRTANSSSVPLMMQRAPSGAKTPVKSSMGATKRTSPDSKRPSGSSLAQTSPPTCSSPPQGSNSSMPLEVTNLDMLQNIPAWLKLLRLHKYTDCLKDVPWQELVELDNDALEAKGVIALGARRKLLKAFDVVKKAHPL